MIRTRSRSDRGFRRAGVRHTPEPQDWADEQFTAEQLQALQDDPEVIVEIITTPAAGEETPASGAGKKK